MCVRSDRTGCRRARRGSIAAAAALALSAPPARAGEVVLPVHTLELQSRAIGATRTLRVMVPDDYDAAANARRTYPVLYLFDGQNLFDAAASSFNRMEWRVDETVGDLVARHVIPPMIVIGIDHPGRRERAREYLPWPDAFLDPPEPEPRGSLLPAFIDEVQQWVAERYRVTSDPGATGIGGSSYGALAAAYVVAKRPGAFGRLLLESPSFYVADGAIFRVGAEVRRWPARVYLGGGTNEGGRADCDPQRDTMPELVADLRRFERMVLGAGVDRAHVRVTVAPCAVHDEEAWAARLPGALAFLYAEPR